MYGKPPGARKKKEIKTRVVNRCTDAAAALGRKS